MGSTLAHNNAQNGHPKSTCFVRFCSNQPSDGEEPVELEMCDDAHLFLRLLPLAITTWQPVSYRVHHQYDIGDCLIIKFVYNRLENEEA